MTGRPRRPLARLPALAAAGAALLLAVVAVALRRGADAARDVPLSPLSAGRRVGADWPERAGIVDPDAPVPAGETDDFGALARAGPPDAGFDPDAVDPTVRAFYEETDAFRMRYTTTWHRPFRLGAALVSPLTARVGQLNLPGRSGGGGELRSRFLPIAPGADPREGARAWVRTDGDGEAVFVAVYATHERDGERLVNIAAPLPGGNLSTVLRVDHLRPGGPGGTGVRLHTGDGERNGGDDPGLYLVTPLGATRLPLSQEFRVLPADAPGTARTLDRTDGDEVVDRTDPSEVAGRADTAGASDRGAVDVVAEHRMSVFGVPFLTVDYRIERTERPPGSE